MMAFGLFLVWWDPARTRGMELMGDQFPNWGFPIWEKDGLCNQSKNDKKFFYLEEQNYLFRNFPERKFDGLCKQAKNDENFLSPGKHNCLFRKFPKRK